MIAEINGVRGTVCDDGFTAEVGAVVCRSLDLGEFVSFNSGSSLTSRIVLDNVKCEGTETNLGQCEYVEDHDCDHSEDLGITCFNNDLKGISSNIKN